MKDNKSKSYSVWAKCNQFVNVNVRASSPEEALEKSKELTEEDFVSVNGEYCDGGFRITGVLEND